MKSHVATALPPALAGIRHAPLVQQRQFLAGDPPPPLSPGQPAISREAANMPDWYVPWARWFFPVTDEFVAHATECAAHKRLPRGWRIHKPGEVYCRVLGRHRLCVIASDHGWLIERNDLLDHDDEQVLTHSLVSAPVLCPTHATAARLAEASYPQPADRYILSWQDL
jgi:hypothetical protein